MIVVEGKRYYTFFEASQETGYTESSIRTYVSKNQVEGYKLPDGWVLTETGMKQLCIRKSREHKKEIQEEDEIIADTKKIEPESEKEEKTDHFVNVNKTIKSEHGPTGKSVHFTTPGMIILYEKLQVLALAKQKPVKEVCAEILEKALAEKEDTLAKIRQLEQQKQALMEQL